MTVTSRSTSPAAKARFGYEPEELIGRSGFDLVHPEDMPTVIDAFTRAALQRDVRSIAKRLGINLVIVTHDIDEAVLMADRALIMAGSPGKIYDELPIDLPDPRERQDPAVQAMRARLMEAFHKAAGGPATGDAENREDAEEPESDSHQAIDAGGTGGKGGSSKPRIVSAGRPVDIG